ALSTRSLHDALPILGLWWWDSVAHAERPAKAPEAAESASAIVPGDLLARSRGFRDLLDAVRQRGQELDEREQAIKGRASALDALDRKSTRLNSSHVA